LYGQVYKASKRKAFIATKDIGSEMEELFKERSNKSNQATLAAMTSNTLAELKEQQKVLFEKIAVLKVDF
jgi:rRNA pseudouridine-1189 N-methylase Emg1 (Nep1/Mra1 family)